MGRAVAIIGTGQTKHGHRGEVTYPDLVREAVQAVFEDAGITPEDIDGVVSGTMPSMMEGVAFTHFYFADALRSVGKPILKTETCGTTGTSLAITGYYWVASGLADVVLVVGLEKMFEGDGQATKSTVVEPYYLRPFLAGAPGGLSMHAQMWMQRYGLSEEKVRDAAAKISVDHHKSAFDNPYAHIKENLTLDEVKHSRIICYPVRIWDVCPNSDGACAVIFASEEKAKKMCRKPAWVKGLSYCGDEYWFGDSDLVIWQCAIDAAKKAYEMAGIRDPIKELDVAEVYNPCTFLEMGHYECFGFCDFGQAADSTLKGMFSRDGALPVTPSGGSCAPISLGRQALCGWPRRPCR